MRSAFLLFLCALTASARLPGRLRAPVPLCAAPRKAAALTVPPGGAIGLPTVETSGGAMPAWYFLAGILLHKSLQDTPHVAAGLAVFGLVAFAHAAYSVATHWSALKAAAADRWNALRGK